MSAQSTSLLGYGLYFIDVFACLLFCITLALVGARFGQERTVAVDLPDMKRRDASGTALEAPSVSVRSRAGELEIFFEGERVTLDEFETRLRGSTPPALVVRAEESPLARVVAVAHEAGVLDIQLAYQAKRSAEPSR